CAALDARSKGRARNQRRMGEPARWASDLPKPVVGLSPVPRQLVDEGALQGPRVAVGAVRLTRQLQRDHDRAQDVALPLCDGAVADADRLRACVARQMWQLA